MFTQRAYMIAAAAMLFGVAGANYTSAQYVPISPVIAQVAQLQTLTQPLLPTQLPPKTPTLPAKLYPIHKQPKSAAASAQAARPAASARAAPSR